MSELASISAKSINDLAKNYVKILREAGHFDSEQHKEAAKSKYGDNTKLFLKECKTCLHVIRFAETAEVICRRITNINRVSPDIQPCEACGGKHENYKCCESCNMGTHSCQYCGDFLGHKEISSCYILEPWED